MHKLVDNLNFALLNIGFEELNANWNWKNVRSPFIRIYYVTGGRARTYIDGKMYVLSPGNLYMIPPFTLHDDECDSFFALYYIHFYEKVNNKEPLFDKFDFPVEISADSLDQLLVERLLDMNPHRELKHIDPKIYDNMPTFSRYIAENNILPQHSFLKTQGILCLLIARFLEFSQLKTRYKDERISKCMQYIHKNIDKDISLCQLTDICYISKDHLARIFKRETGHTPIKYMNIKKIEKAQLLLLTTNLSVCDIAIKLSVDNIPYFNRLFKQLTGMTPCRYRNVHKYNAECLSRISGTE